MAEKIVKGWNLSALNPSSAALSGTESTGSMNSGLTEGKMYEMVIVGTNPDPAVVNGVSLDWHCELVAARNVDDGGPVIEAITGIKPFVMAGFGDPQAREASKFKKVFSGRFKKDPDGKKVWKDVGVKDIDPELGAAIMMLYPVHLTPAADSAAADTAAADTAAK